MPLKSAQTDQDGVSVRAQLGLLFPLYFFQFAWKNSVLIYSNPHYYSANSNALQHNNQQQFGHFCYSFSNLQLLKSCYYVWIKLKTMSL